MIQRVSVDVHASASQNNSLRYSTSLLRAAVVTAGHCMHAELTSRHALATVAVTAVACTPFRVYAN